MKRIEIYRKLIPKNDGPNQIETRLIYDKGGLNVFGSATKTRGFYLYIQPQWIDPSVTPGLMLITLKSGTPSYCKLIKPVSRYTDKAYQQAKEVFKEIEFIRKPFIVKSSNKTIPAGYTLMFNTTRTFKPEYESELKEVTTKMVNTTDVLYLIDYLLNI